MNDPILQKISENQPWTSNFNNILRSGDGVYPNEFFLPGESYSSSLSISLKPLTNKEAFKKLLNVLHNYTRSRIYVRDVSFLGFPSYQVIVPEMFSRKYSLYEIELMKEWRSVAPLIVNMDKRKRSELKLLRNYLEKLTENNPNILYISALTWLPFKVDSQWATVDAAMLLSILNVALYEYEKSIEALEMFMKRINKRVNGDKSHVLRYFLAMRDYLVLKGRYNYHTDSTEKTLKKFYPPEIIKNLIQNMEGPHGAFGDLKIPKCYKCDECDLRRECDYLL